MKLETWNERNAAAWKALLAAADEAAEEIKQDFQTPYECLTRKAEHRLTVKT